MPMRARCAQVLEKALLWQRLRQINEEGALVDAIVDSTRPAGLIVRANDVISGFIPGSHVQTVGLSLIPESQTNQP